MILFVPADLPPLPDKEKIYANFGTCGRAFNFDFERLTIKRDTPYDVTSWDPKVAEKFPSLVSWIENHLPLEKLVSVKLVRAAGPTLCHFDFDSPGLAPDLHEHNRGLEPCGYRLVVRDPGTKNLYVQKSNGTRLYPELPPSTDTYLISHTGTAHGLDPIPQGRLTVFIHGWLYPERHREILARSLEKFRDFAIEDA